MDEIDFNQINEQINSITVLTLPVESGIEFSPSLAVEHIKKSINISELKKASENLSIESRENAGSAVEMTNQSRKIRNRLEEARKSILHPHVDFQRKVNCFIGSIEEELEKIEESLKIKLKDYVKDQHALWSIITEEGSMTRKFGYKWEIEDEGQIPREFLSIDEKKIKEAMKSGIREIKGLKIIQNEELLFRVKN